MNKLTTNFSLEEMLESQTARRWGFAEQFNPPAEVIANLKDLCSHILEPLRAAIGVPIHISSGYRSPMTNSKVGGVPTSQHQKGQAADIQCPSMTNATLFEKIKELKLPYDQLIWEYGNRTEPAWVHVSYGPKQRRQILYIGV
jgi:zinc D-Ala-D-Ala carboxypeptidase